MNYINYLDKKSKYIDMQIKTAHEQAKGLELTPLEKTWTNAQVLLLLIDYRAEMLSHRTTIRELELEIKKNTYKDDEISDLKNECNRLQALSKIATSNRQKAKKN